MASTIPGADRYTAKVYTLTDTIFTPGGTAVDIRPRMQRDRGCLIESGAYELPPYDPWQQINRSNRPANRRETRRARALARRKNSDFSA